MGSKHNISNAYKNGHGSTLSCFVEVWYQTIWPMPFTFTSMGQFTIVHMPVKQLGSILSVGASTGTDDIITSKQSTPKPHYNDVIMGALASQITNHINVYSTVYSGADQRRHQSSASLAFVRGIHRWPVNSPHKGPRTRKMFPFDDVIMMWVFYRA